jgi:predicted pyridoxine 5'-phosphate oxidase superfamily flavin-nucleotide-binding protein
MGYGFLDRLATPAVQAAQAANGSRELWAASGKDRMSDRFTENEIAFIAGRDSFYMASVSQSGWPYVQHRGGPAGFLRVLDEKTLGFADFRGNRQYISLGNILSDDKVAMIMVDYPRRARLKILAHAQVCDLAADAALAARLDMPGYKAKAERAMLLHLEAFDWNCPQHITPRFTMAELEPSLAPLRARLAALEAQNEALRARLAGLGERGDGRET